MLTTKKDPLETHRAGHGLSLPGLRDSRLVVRAKGLRKSFGGQTVLHSVDIELRRGEVVLLRGENGSGKTTLLNILTGNLEPQSGAIHYDVDDSPRNYCFPRRWWKELNPLDHFRPEFVARERIGRTWQDIRLFGSLSLRDNIAVANPGQSGENPLRALFSGWSCDPQTQINLQADSTLAQLGLGGREESSADMVSLGQSKRVAIARAVAAGARVLFLDEPLSGLDRQGIDEVLALLEFLIRERELTLVVVEHVFNQQHLKRLVTTDWLLEGGRIKRSEFRPPEAREEAPGRMQVSTQRPDWFRFMAADSDEVIDELLPRGAQLTRIRQPDRFKEPATPVLEIKDLIVRRGTRTVIGLDEDGKPVGLNLTLHRGEIAILQAPNGWGKSTLFSAIGGFILPDSGSIQINGKSIDGLPAWKRVRQGLGVFQSDRHDFPSLTAKETLILAGNNGKVSDIGLPANQVVSSMSGGQKQQLALLAHGLHSTTVSVRILDEPFSMLDHAAIQEAAENLMTNVTDAVLIAVPSSIL